DAAKEIRGLIDGSMAKVEQGARLVGDAGATMTDIVTEAQRVAGLIAEISTATAEQTEGIAQVGDAVAHLDRATQQNAAMVEQSAAAAQTLKQQAAELAEAVSVFRLALDAPAGSEAWAAPARGPALPQRAAAPLAPRLRAAAG
ncbi:methyl-accepting chemotaxis protein, partial [Comamonas granuli]|uniref:methyl-accepting chemotaxis protein n=1 Tax=Comamonas granuli TaxID=290309 RepID=UPI0005A90EAD